MRIRLITLLLIFMSAFPVFANMLERPAVNDFIHTMAAKHDYDRQALRQIFAKVMLSERIIAAISKPAEGLPWYKYKAIFLTPDRIRQGAGFWHSHRAVLQRAHETYGVPIEIMVAIIGVETRYGKNKGTYKVIDSLSTLAFNYPKRSPFFTRELEHYLLLTQEQGIDPHALKGSYAGAMGIPQFISSSYRAYAVDFDDDGKINIWDNPADAIGSVGNYFARHGWQPGEPVIIRADVGDTNVQPFITRGLEPDSRLARLVNNGIKPQAVISEAVSVKLLRFENKDDFEYWLALKNFYVITRYNHSALYAMAVYQLAGQIKQHYLNHDANQPGQ